MLLSVSTYKIERATMEKRRTMQAFMLRTVVALEGVKVAYDQHNIIPHYIELELELEL